MRLALVLTACGLVLAGAQPGGAAKNEAAVRAAVAAYGDAREARDAQRLASILTPDADQLVSSGEWRKGRDELVRGMLASSGSNPGARTLIVESVRFIAPDVAIADARYEIAGNTQTRRMWSAFVVSRRQGQWRIAAIRNMLPSASGN